MHDICNWPPPRRIPWFLFPLMFVLPSAWPRHTLSHQDVHLGHRLPEEKFEKLQVTKKTNRVQNTLRCMKEPFLYNRGNLAWPRLLLKCMEFVNHARCVQTWFHFGDWPKFWLPLTILILTAVIWTFTTNQNCTFPSSSPPWNIWFQHLVHNGHCLQRTWGRSGKNTTWDY